MKFSIPFKIIVGISLAITFFILLVHFFGGYYVSKYFGMCSGNSRNMPYIDCYCQCYDENKFSDSGYTKCTNERRCHDIN